MQKEAEEHAAEDAKRKEEAETLITAENIVYSTEKLFKELGDKVPKDKVEPVQKEIDELKTLIEKKDTDTIKKKLEEINEQVQKISTELYAHAAEQRGADGRDEAGKDEAENGEKVVDAEYEVKDENSEDASESKPDKKKTKKK